jgi:hypothetical protein
MILPSRQPQRLLPLPIVQHPVPALSRPRPPWALPPVVLFAILALDAVDIASTSPGQSSAFSSAAVVCVRSHWSLTAASGIPLGMYTVPVSKSSPSCR